MLRQHAAQQVITSSLTIKFHRDCCLVLFQINQQYLSAVELISNIGLQFVGKYLKSRAGLVFDLRHVIDP